MVLCGRRKEQPLPKRPRTIFPISLSDQRDHYLRMGRGGKEQQKYAVLGHWVKPIEIWEKEIF